MNIGSTLKLYRISLATFGGRDTMIGASEYQQYLTALLEGDRSCCSNIVSSLLDTELSLESLYTDLFQRSLYDVGDLWEQAKINVAKEHLATAITETLIASVYPKVLSNREPVGRKAVISCSVNEYHQVGARMVADILENRGWDAWFLGANAPLEDLLSMVQEKQPDMLGLSLSIYFNVASLWNLIETVRTNFQHLDILVGGQAFRWGGVEQLGKMERVTYIPSLRDLAAVTSADGS